MRRIIFSLLLLVGITHMTLAEEVTIPIPTLKSAYPRMVDGEACRQAVEQLTATEAGRAAMQGIIDRIEPHAVRHMSEPEWMVGRLQMYWHSHANEIFIDGEQLSHVAGRAPVPTVRYPANRSGHNDYERPKLEEVVPFQDSLGLWLKNKKSGEWEWADPRKTGDVCGSINREIMSLARDAAFLYWLNGDERYARFATDLFDTYVTGLYYREIPLDLNHGQQQTLVGLTSFEVIHENSVDAVCGCYDFLHDWLVKAKPEKIAIYEDALRKWADVIIAGGVPHNNWNLIQAQFILRLGLVLNDNDHYADGHGRAYYLNHILNESSIRQWSIGRLIEFGFDPTTGLWEECPGYATMVLSQFSSFVRLIDRVLGIDLVAHYPILAQGIANAPQYLFPNGLIVGWGDTHYSPLRSDIFANLVANAQRYSKRQEEERFTALYRYFNPQAGESLNSRMRLQPQVSTFTSAQPLQLDLTIPAGSIEQFVTPTFYSEGVSWFTARSGMDAKRSLMFSVNGSKGNHMHANGISMELYGKGYVMGVDLGRGKGYTTLDYAEFYSQFPAHNTVCVDGCSSYPVMMSQHAFRLESCYPQPEQREGLYDGVLYGDISFIEPETQSDQRRQLLIINTDPEAGYYVDVFRSRRRNGEDKTHDYFYHNIGQQFTLDLPTEPTEELAFAGGHLYAYSYLWNKHSVKSEQDVTGRFVMQQPDNTTCGMQLWMRGEKERRLFTAYSPHIDAMTRTPMPYDVKNSPCQTFIARQYGEAWNRPFAAVFEPYDQAGSQVKAVEWLPTPQDGTVIVKVAKQNGRIDYIFSADAPRAMQGEAIRCTARLAVVSGEELFMAEGTSLHSGEVRIESNEPTTAAVARRNGVWHYTAEASVTIYIGKKRYRMPAGAWQAISE